MTKNKRETPNQGYQEETNSDTSQKDSLTSLAEEVEQLKEALETAQRKELENLEALQRERADFKNYMKRVDRERESNAQEYKIKILKNYLPVLDDLQLAMRNQPATLEEGQKWIEGMDLILRKFETINKNEGLEQIDAENVPFDPIYHEAISMEDTPDVPSGTVIDVLKNGYKIGDRIIRHAMVRVAK